MIEVNLLLTDEEAQVLERAILNYATRLEYVTKSDTSAVHVRETRVLVDVTHKYLAAVA